MPKLKEINYLLVTGDDSSGVIDQINEWAESGWRVHTFCTREKEDAGEEFVALLVKEVRDG